MNALKDSAELDLYRRMAKEFGKKGGRPRTRIHIEEAGCDCAECRIEKKGTRTKKSGSRLKKT